MKHSLQLKLSQHLTLTPQLQQSIKLLQLSTVELNQELERYLLENPLLERSDSPADEATIIRRTNTVSGTTNITFYFRNSPTFANPGQFGSFNLNLLRDDAGVVYFNGTEVFRSPNLPAGTISFNTLATSTGENTVDTTNIFNSGTLLSNGVNVVACEIHQQALSSSDVSFDLQLTGLPPVSQTLYSGRFGAELVLYWADPTFRLESTDTLPGGWVPVVGAASPWAVSPFEAKRFYRLRNP